MVKIGNMPIQGNFRVVFNKKVGPDYFKMAVFAPGIVKEARPGQFVHLRCSDGTEPLLRRPISFHRLKQSSFEILYKTVGRGTLLLAEKQKGDKIDVLGPLGNGFDFVRTPNNRHRTPILVAGGMGAAPLLALAEKMVHGLRFAVCGKKQKLYVLIGANTKGHILCEKDFKKLGADVRIATEDGSFGHKGLITDLLKKVLRVTCDLRRVTLYACGPKPMLREIARISSGLHIPAYASLEENMACGVGACLGCAVRTKSGYKRVCKDGPVFALGEIKW